MSSMSKVGSSDFEVEVISSGKLTLVDFGADWCGPCKKLHPVMNALAAEFGDRIKVVEVNVGDSPEIAMKFGVTSVPQLLFFKDGMVRESVVGLLPKSKIAEKIKQYIDR